MALVKCKECNEVVSTKAKNCPKCGADAPRKTSLFTWIAIIPFVIFVYSVVKAPTPVTTKSNILKDTKEIVEATPSPKSPLLKPTPPKPSWRTSESKDAMTGKFSAYAHSPKAYPTGKMSSPYSNIHSYMGVGCDSESEWVYFGFNRAPNLTGGDIKDGYNLIETRIKWGEKIVNVALTQDWGDKFISFRDDSRAISNISASKSGLLELQWYGEQTVYFDFTLNGSFKALSKIRALCSKERDEHK